MPFDEDKLRSCGVMCDGVAQPFHFCCVRLLEIIASWAPFTRERFLFE